MDSRANRARLRAMRRICRLGWFVSLGLVGCLELATFPAGDAALGGDAAIDGDTATGGDTATEEDTAVREDTATGGDTAIAEDTAIVDDAEASGAADAGEGDVDATVECTPPCANGGDCVGPGVCDCEGTGFVGATCEDAVCGGVVCPEVAGYLGACNAAEHCEYARVDADAPWHEDDVWIYVPPGKFPMGAPEGEEGSLPSERPVREVRMAEGYLIARHAVTVRMHEACEAAEECAAPSTDDFGGALPPTVPWGLNRSDNGRSRHPQNGISWYRAADICGWLGGRRPTEAEWEYAAKGEAHRRFPWGDAPEPVCTVHAIFRVTGTGCGSGGAQVQLGTWEVGADTRAEGASAVGAYDMAGSVWEWTEDGWCEDTTGAPDDGSAAVGCSAVGYRTTKGGGFASFSESIRAARRSGSTPSHRSAVHGVRCVRELP